MPIKRFSEAHRVAADPDKVANEINKAISTLNTVVQLLKSHKEGQARSILDGAVTRLDNAKNHIGSRSRRASSRMSGEDFISSLEDTKKLVGIAMDRITRGRHDSAKNLIGAIVADLQDLAQNEVDQMQETDELTTPDAPIQSDAPVQTDGLPTELTARRKRSDQHDDTPRGTFEWGIRQVKALLAKVETEYKKGDFSRLEHDLELIPAYVEQIMSMIKYIKKGK